MYIIMFNNTHCLHHMYLLTSHSPKILGMLTNIKCGLIVCGVSPAYGHGSSAQAEW